MGQVNGPVHKKAGVWPDEHKTKEACEEHIKKKMPAIDKIIEEINEKDNVKVVNRLMVCKKL